MVMPQANPTAVVAAPGSTDGAIGEIRIDSSISPQDGQSIVWIKTAADTWTNLGKYSSTAAAAGATGDQGNQGTQGTAGAAGSQGAQGPQGTQGPQGPQGPKGDNGSGGSYTHPSQTLTLAGAVTGTVNFTDGAIPTMTTALTGGTTYSFKTTAGGLNPQTTIGNGGLVSFIGGTEMVVTQSGSTFTFNYVGTTSAEYVSTTKTSDQTLLSSLITKGVYPVTDNTYQVGHVWKKYASGYFGGPVYAGSHVSVSDRSLKQSFGAAPGLDFVNALGPLSFEYKETPGEVHWGLVAQDVETVCDNLSISSVVVHEQPDTGIKHLNYMEFTAPIVKAIQELTERLEALENG
jgi:hypothetical protein